MSDSGCAKPPVGISQCLTGAAVRYDGDHQHSPLYDLLSPYLDFRPLCPETAIGLGVPRPPIHLRQDADGQLHAVDKASGQHDVTLALQAQVTQQQDLLAPLCGYILMQRSPSCGLASVKRHDEDGLLLAGKATGIYARELAAQHPDLPLVEEAGLHDAEQLDHFLTRVFTRWRWQETEGHASVAALQSFHARHKYLLMACRQSSYRELGQLLAGATPATLRSVTERYRQVFMSALSGPPDRGNHANALQHMAGYLKRSLSGEERQTMENAITAYQAGQVTRHAITHLLRQHLERHPQPYLLQQACLFPYPASLQAAVLRMAG